jgi:hypothetical protein
LTQNADEVVGFFHQIRQLTKSRNVFVDLAEVTVMTPDAIAGLLATINHNDRGRGLISGNVPRNQAAHKMLNGSGFREYVRSNDPSLFRATLGKIQKRSKSRDTLQTRFHQSVAGELIEFATKMLTGAPKHHGPSYSIFCEAMLNTMNHASPNDSDDEPWWASVYFDESRTRACFTFIDQGRGIFKSHRLTARLNVLKHLTILSHAEILQRLFQGSIPSTTGLPGRGNGIPGMYNHSKAGRISSFTLLTNDVVGEAETETYRMLKNSFRGTIIYWEVAP